MSVLGIVLYSLVVLVALMLIGLVLVQPSKSGGFGGSFGGLGETVFGAHAISHLSKLTVFFISVFFVLVFSLALLNSKKSDDSSTLQGLGNDEKIANTVVDSGKVKDSKKTINNTKIKDAVDSGKVKDAKNIVTNVKVNAMKNSKDSKVEIK